MPNLKVIDSGFYTSIQDMGRFGYRSLGIPVSGPMDETAFKSAQQAVGNQGDEALLECTLKGPKLLFGGSGCVAVCGAPMSIRLNDQEMPMDRAFECHLGDFLELGNCVEGMRTYISFSGGIQTPFFMGSRSYFSPVTPTSKVHKADTLFFVERSLKNLNITKQTLASIKIADTKLQVRPGPEWDVLSKKDKKQLLNQTFEVGSNDRMGYRLTGKLPKNNLLLPSSSIVPGVVQLTPYGTLLVAMADAQITGGYPRILILEGDAKAILAQKHLGKKITLSLV